VCQRWGRNNSCHLVDATYGLFAKSLSVRGADVIEIREICDPRYIGGHFCQLFTAVKKSDSEVDKFLEVHSPSEDPEV